MMACAASITGAGGTRVNPAPSRADRSRWDPDVTRRVTLLPLVTARREPSAVEFSRLEPWVRVESAPAPAVTAPSGAEAPPGAAATGVAGELGGRPQTSQ
jgi:hypothetical protein